MASKSGGFVRFGLEDIVLKALVKQGFTNPTPIQKRVIPVLMRGSDAVAMARTGSGKTAAFVLPILHRLKEHSAEVGIRCVILSPTRELALQTGAVIRKFSMFTDLRTAILVGGDSMEAQFAALADNPDIVVATPGRLMHHLDEVGVSLERVQAVVYDEADRLFDEGFGPQLAIIHGKIPSGAQSVLVSATMPHSLAEFARARLSNPEVVRLDTDSKISAELKLSFLQVTTEHKPAALMYLLSNVIGDGAKRAATVDKRGRIATIYEKQTVIFAATRHHVEFLSLLLRSEGLSVGFVYGSMEQNARQTAIASFRNRRQQFLVVTDVAARGLDIPLLDFVVHYDFPSSPRLFVHRSGRVARAGREGRAFALVAPDETPYLLDLHLYIGRSVKQWRFDNPAAAEGADAEPEIPEGADVSNATSLLAAAAERAKAVQAAADQALKEAPAPNSAADDGYLGAVPQGILDVADAGFRAAISNDAELKDTFERASRAYGLYYKTRPSASPQSARRARLLSRESVHPLFAEHATRGGEAARTAVVQLLRQYRPGAGETTLEIGKTSRDPTKLAMERKRKHDDKRIAAHAERAAKRRQVAAAAEASLTAAKQTLPDDGKPKTGGLLTLGKFQAENHLSYDPQDEATLEARKAAILDRLGSFQTRGTAPQALSGATSGVQALDDSVLEILGDESTTLRSQQKATGLVTRWDPKKRRYVKFDPRQRADEEMQRKADRRKTRVQTEDGQWVEVDDDGRRLEKVKDAKGDKSTRLATGAGAAGLAYSRWKARTHRAIPSVGSSDESDGSTLTRGAKQGFSKYKGKNAPAASGAAPASKVDESIASTFTDANATRKQSARKLQQQVYQSQVAGQKGKKKPSSGGPRKGKFGR
jgi:ATP-dependent RNA helicase DDX54/DBP10